MSNRQKTTCPCTWVGPCITDTPGCTCLNPASSYGCLRCNQYGSYAQRYKKAKWLAQAIDAAAKNKDRGRNRREPEGGTMTEMELRIKMAEANGWTDITTSPPDNRLVGCKPGVPQQWYSLPDLDHWFKGCTVDLARKGYYLYGLSDYFAVFPVGRPSDYEEVCRDADEDVAVCTAWLNLKGLA